MTTAVTAELSAINLWDGSTWFDEVTVRDHDGRELDVLRVPPAEEVEPYDRALRCAGYAGAVWV